MEKLKKSKLYLLGGIPGLGKSTWIKNHEQFFEGTVKVISRDQIRFSLLKDGDEYFSKEGEVWTEYVNQAIKSLKENDNTILDATHLNFNSRNKIIRALGKNLKDIDVNIIFFIGDLALALKRNAQRTGRALVPESTIINMYHSIDLPSYELEPYLDNLYIVNMNNINDQIINVTKSTENKYYKKESV